MDMDMDMCMDMCMCMDMYMSMCGSERRELFPDAAEAEIAEQGAPRERNPAPHFAPVPAARSTSVRPCV